MSNIKAEASLDFLNAPIAEKIQKGKTIAEMTEKVIDKLPDLPYSAVQMKAANTELEAKNSAAADGSHSAIAARNEYLAIWINIFRENGKYISLKAKGNVEFIRDTGYKPTSTEVFPRPASGELIGYTGKAGETKGIIVHRCDKQEHTVGYVNVIVPKNTVVEQVGNVITVKVGETTVYINADTHYKGSIPNLPSKQDLDMYGVGFNHKGMGPLTKAGGDISPK